MNFSVFDIESRDWKILLVMAFYDGENYAEFYNIKSFMEYLFSPRNITTTCYAHFGGIFDFLFIIDFLFSENSDAEYQIKNIIQTGRKILKFDIVYNKKKISFVDSSGLFPFGLEKLTHSFDVKHKKLKEDVGNLTKVTPKLLKYLMHDCKGLYECIEKFSQETYINQVGLKLTRSGTSYAIYKELFNSNLPEIPHQVKDFARKGYFGGRTEIFKPLYNKCNKTLKVYDVNSLYPSVMHDYEYPSEFSHWTTEIESDYFGVYQCIVECPKNIKIPLLGTKHNGKYVFPTGTFEGVFNSPELEKAISIGYIIHKVIKGAIFENGGFMFKKFVKHFYDLRKKTKDPVKKIIYKDVMNHLYGRLGINKTRESISFEPTDNCKISSVIDFGEYEVRLYATEKEIYTYSNPVLSSFVTSYARIRLYEFMESVNFNIYYCDTDSLFTPRKMKSSNKLGAMKLEYELTQACFLLPKTYCGIKPNADIVKKMKGFPAKRLTHIDYKDFVESISGEMRIPPVNITGGLAGIKTAFRKGEILHVLPDSTKQLRAKYDKRIITFKNNVYDTIPIHLELENAN